MNYFWGVVKFRRYFRNFKNITNLISFAFNAVLFEEISGSAMKFTNFLSIVQIYKAVSLYKKTAL